MKNITLVAKREFFTQVKKKSFIILTILTPLLLIGFGVAISFIFKANKSENIICVVDKSGIFTDKLKQEEIITYQFVSEDKEQALKKDLEDKKEGLDGVLIIPKTQNYQQLESGIKLLTNKNIGNETRGKITNDISEIIKSNKIKDLGVDKAQIQELDRKIQLNVTNILEQDKEENEMVLAVKMGFSMLLMYIIFIFILVYGARVMRSVLEEKNNRVVEILISSVKPFDLMMGKIIGITGVALVQFFIWAIMVFFSFQFLDSLQVGGMIDVGEIQMIFSLLKNMDYGLMIFVFVVYFLLGYLFYSSIYAAIGASVDNETETQQFMVVVMIPMMLGFYGSVTIINNPDGPMSFWLSMIPFTSPIAMLARIPFNVPMWELVLSIVILLISTLFMVVVASKIYRIGILMYGNKVTWKDLWKWLKN